MSEWQPIGDAPRDGTLIEVRSNDWGTGPGISTYRARWSPGVSGRPGVWFNWDRPGEELEYLFEWRPTEQPTLMVLQKFDKCPDCGGEVYDAIDTQYCDGSGYENFADGCGWTNEDEPLVPKLPCETRQKPKEIIVP